MVQSLTLRAKLREDWERVGEGGEGGEDEEGSYVFVMHFRMPLFREKRYLSLHEINKNPVR